MFSVFNVGYKNPQFSTRIPPCAPQLCMEELVSVDCDIMHCVVRVFLSFATRYS